MAYQSINNHQKTTNRSDRNIDKQFNMVEFNRLFEQNNLPLENKNETSKSINNDSNQSPNILFIITCILLIIGISLLLFNNFINFS